jgi:hypothetical protein
VSNDADLSTEDLARSGAGREGYSAAAGERTSEQRSNVTAPGTGEEIRDVGAPGGAGPGVASGEYAGASQMEVPATAQAQGRAAAPEQGAGTEPVPGDRGAAPGDRDGGMRPLAGDAGSRADMALLDPVDGERFQQRWSDVQARFVDDPRGAVQTADGLVAELMQSLARGFSDHKARLETAWQSGGDPDTEELRQALQRYRSFFHRLLST